MSAKISRESSIPGQFYRRAGYAGYLTLFSLIEQIRWVVGHELREVLYIGVGNGFVPACLRAHGVEVTTADVNAALAPDVVCDLTRLTTHLEGRRFQAVMACEVLEHIPFVHFAECVRELSTAARQRVLVTLPVFRRFPLRVCGAVKIGGLERAFGLWLPLPKARVPAEHEWEIGSSRETGLRRVREAFREQFCLLEDSRLKLNPYHHMFDLRPR